MASYSIDDLYDKGYINGEVYYLCDENGISCIEDAVQLFSSHNLPHYLEVLRNVYYEINSSVPQTFTDFGIGWRDDCINISKQCLGYVHETIYHFNSFVVFFKFVLSQDGFYGQYYYGKEFKGEIEKYWKSRLPESVDDLTAPWRITCKNNLLTYPSIFRNCISNLINLYPNKESFIADLKLSTYANEILKISNFDLSGKQLIESLISKFLDCLGTHRNADKVELSVWEVVSQDELWLQKFYSNTIKLYSVRTKNVLDSVLKEYSAYSSFFVWIQSPEFEPMKLNKAGRKTAMEINEWRQHVISSFASNFSTMEEEQIMKIDCLKTQKTKEDTEESNTWEVLLEDDIWLQNYYNTSLKSYSSRTKNALNATRDECSSYSSFFKRVLSPKFDPMSIHNAGRKTATEINEWKKRAIESFISRLNAMEEMSLPNDVDSPGNQAPRDKELLFHDFFLYLDSLNATKKELAIYIVKSASFNGLTEVAESINVTRERTRQLLPTILNYLGIFFLEKHKQIELTKEEYLNIANHCGYNLNNDFLMWAGSLVSNEIAIVGTIEECICKGKHLIVVDGKLSSIFDFSKFVSRVDSLQSIKYYKETKVIIEDIILDCFIYDVQFEYLQSVHRECRAILYEHFPYHLTEKEIIIPANAYYSIRQRVEDILEIEGTPMTIESIRRRLSDSGATFNGSDNQLVSMIRKSTLVISYGNPTKYGLTKWDNKNEGFYGNIRDVAIQMLLQQKPHLQPVEGLVRALLTVFTESSERSILNNLLMDSKQRFGLYEKDGIIFIGLTNEINDSSYKLIIKGEAPKKVSSSQKRVNWQGTFDSVKRVLSSHSWTALDGQQRKWLINNWKKAQQGALQEWQATQIVELIENSKKR